MHFFSAASAHRALALLLSSALLVALANSPGPAQADGSEPLVRLETTLGDILLELDTARAPRSVENFLEYVDSGFYDGTVFHRVIEGFMIQGGGFTSDYEQKSTRTSIRNEADNRLPNRRYTIAMARTNAPHSATSQFFINVADNRNLDHTAPTPRGWGYTVFGRVTDGFATVDAIAETDTGPAGRFSQDVPRTQVVIERAVRVGLPGTDSPDTAAPDAGAPVATPASTDRPAGMTDGDVPAVEELRPESAVDGSTDAKQASAVVAN